MIVEIVKRAVASGKAELLATNSCKCDQDFEKTAFLYTNLTEPYVFRPRIYRKLPLDSGRPAS